MPKLSKYCIFCFQLNIMAKAFFTNIQNLTENEDYRLSKQFEKHIVVTDTCHIWQGRTDTYGYGEVRIQFRGARVCLKAHRVIFALSNKDIVLTESKDVSHLCHNRCCVKLEHLSYEPHSINNQRLVCRNEGECFGHHGYSHCFI